MDSSFFVQIRRSSMHSTAQHRNDQLISFLTFSEFFVKHDLAGAERPELT